MNGVQYQLASLGFLVAAVVGRVAFLVTQIDLLRYGWVACAAIACVLMIVAVLTFRRLDRNA